MVELNKSQVQIQKAARAFAKGEFDKDLILSLDRSGDYPWGIHSKAAELGFIGIHFPEDYSGGGLGIFESVLVSEALCTRDSSLGSTLGMAGYGSECILRFGNHEQKKKFLPGIAEGTMLSGVAFTEPENGCDITRVSTTAVHENGHYRINGCKSHVINGKEAGFYLVLCQTDLFARPYYNGSALFIVESDRDGVVASGTGDRLGMNMMSSATVEFSNVEIPEENLVGDAGKGYQYAQAFLSENRLMTAAQAVGVAQGACDRAIDYIKKREQFNRPISQFQSVRHKIADMAVRITQAKLVTYAAARFFDTGNGDPSMSSIAKLSATNAAMSVTDDAIQLFGGYGYMREYEIEHFYRDAKVLQIRNGNRFVQKDIIADHRIGTLKKRQG